MGFTIYCQSNLMIGSRDLASQEFGKIAFTQRTKVNLVSPGFTRTNLNGYEGTASVEDGSREVVRVALLGPDGPTGTFTRWENATIPW